MFWADRIAGEVKARFGASKPIVIRDEKTVSGRVHIGSMRGVAIHGAVHEALTDTGAANEFVWEHNDFDPMDDIPTYLDRATFEPHLGKPLYTIPSPEASAKNFGEFYAKEFQSVIEATGFHPRYVWASELYLSGKMDGVIREALEHAEDIRRIMKEVSGAERKEGWLPISVICEQCGKMTTTEATDFDESTVAYTCLKNKVAYTEGCGHSGRISPFGGRSKLYWKTDWPAKWKVYDVMVEGGGKDHSTKGGSRDVANHISKEVFNYEPPFDMPYEFLLVGGKKMSSSKGRGSSAKEISELVPPKILRLALLGKDINQQFNFDPESDTVPLLYDLYDKLAEGYWAGVKDDYAKLFEFIHPERKISSQSVLPRFSQVAFVVQMPHMDLYKEFPKADKAELDERAKYAKRWLEAYAPEKFVFKLQDTLPEAAKSLSEAQKAALAEILRYIEGFEAMPSGEELHKKLHEIKEAQGIKPSELFGAIYLAFLGKSYGPQAGWFISALPHEFVIKRLKEVVG
ncbi:lysine--tRNA ligase [Candidatus Adlerbacteria bacterium RIFCSPHIGHO2_12_FULL_53_18]|uniref:Lysine--tRNA ligase n=2 Tax=Parcubacteria group TaxID=1794811 RepID=A0A1F4XS42_9BACT|nr:MAG: lysine--tRNA ligase [Candidatus Adlerbacteria bacterium RIFCSPHIGHO2_12_FULL_53_18]OGG51264.1 MAG: lysine--tRNA ligase [Candidatus Kaiserbacteria bacterium RIFCSPHIGHO2_01_FULL_54_36b]